MFKSIIKEISIILLILISIVLVLAIVLYDYNPNNKTIPKQLEEYKLPELVESELSASGVSEPQGIVKTYRIEEEDLDLYEETEEYDRGKINPFRLSDNSNETKVNNVSGIINTIGK